MDPVGLVVAQQEADRERAARGLHDEPLQTLCASLLRLQVLQRSVEEHQAAELGRVIDALRDAIAQLQDLQTELYPTALDLLDLEALVLEDIRRIFPDRAEPSTGTWSPAELPPVARLALVRVLRDILEVAATAGAAPREIAATATGGTTTLAIDFAAGPTPTDDWTARLDRPYLEARVRVAGGTVEVTGHASGVRVQLSVRS